MRRGLKAIALAGALSATLLAACGDDAGSKTTAVQTVATTGAADAAAATTTTVATGRAGKVSASTASSAEIQAALEASGVPNAARWTREVMEYRPYPAEDADLTKLRNELAKYNPGPGVVDKIVSALTP
jgi:hypothetical protein